MPEQHTSAVSLSHQQQPPVPTSCRPMSTKRRPRAAIPISFAQAAAISQPRFSRHRRAYFIARWSSQRGDAGVAVAAFEQRSQHYASLLKVTYEPPQEKQQMVGRWLQPRRRRAARIPTRSPSRVAAHECVPHTWRRCAHQHAIAGFSHTPLLLQCMPKKERCQPYHHHCFHGANGAMMHVKTGWPFSRAKGIRFSSFTAAQPTKALSFVA